MLKCQFKKESYSLAEMTTDIAGNKYFFKIRLKFEIGNWKFSYLNYV